MNSNEAWIMALEIAADTVCKHDGGIPAGEDWRSPHLQRVYVAIRKEIARLEQDNATNVP